MSKKIAQRNSSSYIITSLKIREKKLFKKQILQGSECAKAPMHYCCLDVLLLQENCIEHQLAEAFTIVR